MKNIILNSSNIVYDPINQNRKLQYNFPSTQEFKNKQIAISSLLLAQSWINIGFEYNNNLYLYVWYGAGGPTLHSVIVADGFYTIDQFNAYLNYVMASNGHYLIDDNGDFVYYLQIVYNTSYSVMEFRSVPIPTALPVGWSNPAGITFPAVASTPSFIIPDNNIQDYLGFPYGSYPTIPQATIYNELSPNPPDTTPVHNVITRCSLVKNELQYPNDILYTGVPTSSIAFPVSINPKEYVFTDIQDGFYSSFDIQFFNQNLEPFNIKDNSVFIQLIFKDRNEVSFKQ